MYFNIKYGKIVGSMGNTSWPAGIHLPIRGKVSPAGEFKFKHAGSLDVSTGYDLEVTNASAEKGFIQGNAYDDFNKRYTWSVFRKGMVPPAELESKRLLAAKEAKSKKETLQASIGEGKKSAIELEVLYWDSIKDSEDIKKFEDYLRKYPDGLFAELAKIKINKLSQQAAINPKEPWTGTWKVRGSPWGDMVFKLKQSGNKVKSIRGRSNRLKAKVKGDRLKGWYEAGVTVPIDFKIAKDSKSFKGTEFRAGTGTVYLKGERQE